MNHHLPRIVPEPSKWPSKNDTRPLPERVAELLRDLRYPVGQYKCIRCREDSRFGCASYCDVQKMIRECEA